MTTASRSSTAQWRCRFARVPLPQSIQIAVPPLRTRYPLHAPPAGAPYEPDVPNTVSSTSAPVPVPRDDGADLGAEEPGAEGRERVRVAAGDERAGRGLTGRRRPLGRVQQRADLERGL